MLRLILLFLISTSSVLAESVVIGMDKEKVAITATFDGSQILLFGAVKRDKPAPIGDIQIIVSIAGPSEPISVHKKSKVFGIWMNTDTVEVDAAPSFYAVATSSDFSSTINDTDDLRYKVSIPRAIRSVSASVDVLDTASFSDAVIRIRSERGLYQLLENTVNIDEQTLFRTSINMPGDISDGDYTARILLTRDGNVIDEFSTIIDVRKVGLERFLFNMSRESPLAYGLMSIAIAIFAGWAASLLFRIFRAA
jgi:uncharacterized protein (TIGR02186 family)